MRTVYVRKDCVARHKLVPGASRHRSCIASVAERAGLGKRASLLCEEGDSVCTGYSTTASDRRSGRQRLARVQTLRERGYFFFVTIRQVSALQLLEFVAPSFSSNAIVSG